ncbi:MAG: protein kinase [Deltaproteobacteria bacterium]|nr:protein kinase [Deltaproteobacteria bacterium]
MIQPLHHTHASQQAPDARDPVRRRPTMPDCGAGAIVRSRYEVRHEIARGGMCVVHCARDLRTGRFVALKVLGDEFAGDPNARRRLLREARALELSKGPHVVGLLEAGKQGNGSPYLVMEMLEGRTLEAILATRGRLRIDHALELGMGLCTALARVHARNVVHRDIKPANIIVVDSPDGSFQPCLIDFGIAALVQPGIEPVALPAAETKITRAGEFFGTPEYIAPEVVRNPGIVDRRSDLYSLGITLYECLTGAVPYSGGFCEVTVKVLLAGGPPNLNLVRPEIDVEVARLLGRALAPSADARYSTALEMQHALAQGLQSLKERNAAQLRTQPVPAPSAPLTPQAAPPHRRRYPRAHYVTPARIVIPGATPVRGRTEDVSEGGLLVLAEKQCPNNARVWVYFMSPITGSEVGVEATTRWVRNARHKAAVGLEFTTLTHRVRREIALFVERESHAART